MLETANFIKREHLCINLRVLVVLGPAFDISSIEAKTLPAVISSLLGATPPVTSDLPSAPISQRFNCLPPWKPRLL